jgi:cholera toxin transcriptional activator
LHGVVTKASYHCLTQIVDAILLAFLTNYNRQQYMDMIQFDTATIASAEPKNPADLRSAKATDNVTCLTIRTGDEACIARFYPSRYQLTLIKQGVEEKVDLGFSGSRLLERLVRNPGEVVDRDELMDHAWSGRVVGQGSLNQQIYTLRQILSDESTRDIIQTLPRRGYLINPKYIEISVETPPSPAVEPEVTTAPSPVSDSAEVKPLGNTFGKRWLVPVVIGCTSLLLLGAAVNYQHQANLDAAKTPGKLLNITYAPDHPHELPDLISYVEKIKQSLSANVKHPLHLVVGFHENVLDVVCMRADGSAVSLHFTENQRENFTAKDLASCL